MARHLIVLGGGEDQLPAYAEGRRLGYRVIGVDMRPDALGAAVADEFVNITIRDADAIAAHLGDIEVAAVISPASDTALPAVAALSRRYATKVQLPPLAVRASLDKGYFRAVVDRLGLPGYAHVEGGDAQALVAAARAMTYPLIVKPVDGSGSKGLELVTAPAELPAALDRLWRHSFAHRAAVEEVVRGRHCSVECFLADGKARFTIATDRTLTEPPYLITTSHLLPADLDPATLVRLEEMLVAVCAEIGHRDGPINVDFVLADDGTIYLIEFGARIGGAGLPLLIEQATGVNTVAAAIRQAAGEPFDLTPTRSRAVLLRILYAPHDGTLARMADPAAIRELPGVLDMRTFVPVGARVRGYTQAAYKLGYLIVAAADRHELALARDRALHDIGLLVTPHDAARRLDS